MLMVKHLNVPETSNWCTEEERERIRKEKERERVGREERENEK